MSLTGAWGGYGGGVYTEDLKRYSARVHNWTSAGTITQKIHPLHAMHYRLSADTGSIVTLELPDLSSMQGQLGLIHIITNTGVSSGGFRTIALEDVHGRSYGTVGYEQTAYVFCILETTKGVDPGVPIYSVHTRTLSVVSVDSQA